MHRILDEAALTEYAAKLKTFSRVALAAVLLVLAMAFAAPAKAQVATLTPTQAPGPGVTPILTWSSTPSGASCVGSGDAAWNGAKAASGTQTLAKITTGKIYVITCTWAGDTTATLTWLAPTTNVDGSALAKCASADSSGQCLAYFNVYRKLGSTDMSSAEVTPVRDPNAVTFVKTGLGAGVQNFAIEVVNGNGAPSALSPIASKTITASASATDSVSYVFPGSTILTVK